MGIMKLYSHHVVVMCEDVVHRVVTMEPNLYQEAKHEDKPFKAHEANTYNEETISIKVVTKVEAIRTEASMEVDIAAILNFTTEAGLTKAKPKVEIEMVIEEEHGGDQVEGPTTTEVIEILFQC